MKNPLRKLHWQLALLFSIVSTGVSIAINLGQVVVSLNNAPEALDVTDSIIEEIDSIAPDLVKYLIQSPANKKGLKRKASKILVYGLEYSTEAFNFIPSINRVDIYDHGAKPITTAVNNNIKVHEKNMKLKMSSIKKKTITIETDPETGETIILYPLKQNGQTIGFIRVLSFIPTKDNLSLIELSDLYLENFLKTLGASLILGALFGYLISRRLMIRIHDIITATTQWSQGVFNKRVDDIKGDELSLLGKNLNLMAEDLKHLFETRMRLAASQERSKLARDLHDTIKQKIFSARMQLSAAELLIKDDPVKAREILKNIRELNNLIQEELAEIIHSLRPGKVENLGVVEAIRQYSQNWSRQSLIRADVFDQTKINPPGEIEDVLFRIMQEALANIEKHSNANSLSIDIKSLSNSFKLIIIDDGIGFDTKKTDYGSGLRNMKNRIEEIGGTLKIESRPGSGTRLMATLNIADKTGNNGNR